MKVGVQMIFQSTGTAPRSTDGQVVAEEVLWACSPTSSGFDALWPVEHHFEDYAFCPDNTLFLAHMAARTRRIRSGPAR
jgi:hypothetical protein